MATLKIKGKKELVELSATKAITLKNRWLGLNGEAKRDSEDTFHTDEYSGHYGDIGWIEVKNSETQAKHYSTGNQKWLEERKLILMLSPEDRAKSLGLFSILWWGFTGSTEISDDIKLEARKRQKEFYEKNSNRVHPDPELFKDMLGDSINESAMGIIGRVIGTDRAHAEKEDSYLESLEEITLKN